MAPIKYQNKTHKTSSKEASKKAALKDSTQVKIMKDENVENLLTPASFIEKLTMSEKSIELIVSISNINGHKMLYSKMKNKEIGRFSFMTHSKDDQCQVQFVAWEEQAQRLGKVKLSPRDIVHMDGLAARPIDSNFNKGSVAFQFVANSSTTITVLQENTGRTGGGKEPEAPLVLNFEDIPKHDNFIKIRGFIKSNFAVVKRDLKVGPNFICGSITDGHYKLEIQIPASSLGESDFQKGQHVEILGILKKNAKPLHFVVDSIINISIIDEETMDLFRLMSGWRYLELQNPTKKQRTN